MILAPMPLTANDADHEQFKCKCGKPAWYWITTDVDTGEHIASCNRHIGEDLNSRVGDPNLVMGLTPKVHRYRKNA